VEALQYVAVNAPKKKPPIVVICGPTGVGKTDFAVELAAAFDGEILGADSMQLYRRMDIGTAKPSPAQRSRIRHHLVDAADPDEEFDAARYAREARAVVDTLLERGCLPFVVGGTGLYITALLRGIFPSPRIEPAVRDRLARRAEADGSPAMHQRLAEVDPEAAVRIHPNDTFRILRALEVFEQTGRTITELHRKHRFADVRYHALKIGLTADREALYRRIDRRVDRMMADGLLEEVRGLLAKGYPPSLKSMQSLGYRHMIDFLQGRCTLEEAVIQLKRDHRRYAKRQLTWFRADKETVWLGPEEEDRAREMIRRHIEDGPKSGAVGGGCGRLR